MVDIYFSHSDNNIGKYMHPAIGKSSGRLGYLALAWQPALEKGKPEIKPVKLHLKIDLVSYPAGVEDR